MAPSTTNFTLHSILEKEKLNRTNYMDWICNLRIVLRVEKKEDVLDNPLPEEPEEGASAAERKHVMWILKGVALCSRPWNPSCKSSLRKAMRRTI